MKFKVKYTITLIREENTDNWGSSETPDQVLVELKKYLEEDCSYIMDDAMTAKDDKIEVELVS